MLDINRKYKILFVDDDPFMVNIIRTIFKDEYYILFTADNGKQGFKKAKKEKPDLIISDAKMPDMDGIEFCKLVKEDEELSKTMFLLSTAAMDEAKDAIKGLEQGADDYLIKPFEKRKIRAKVDALLRIKILQDELFLSNQKLKGSNEKLEKHKNMLESSNHALESEKRRLTNSLKEVSFLIEELEESRKHHMNLNRDLKNNFNDVITLLAALVELRLPFNKGHFQSVAFISKYIIGLMDLDEQEKRDIEIAALLHEIGKIGLPDDIVAKNPKEYTSEEQARSSQHCLIGESLLRGYSGLDNVAKIVRHLYENVDGSGFPDNLAGVNIPLGSKMIRIVAKFDNATYQHSESRKIYQVIKEIENEVDSKYDGQLVQYLKDYVNGYADRRKSRKTERINVTDLKDGMVLAVDLYTSTGIKLIPAGTTMTDALINTIFNYNKTDSFNRGIIIEAP